MYNLITASHFFSAGSSLACIQVVGITISKYVHSQCYDLIRPGVRNTPGFAYQWIKTALNACFLIFSFSSVRAPVFYFFLV